MAYSCRPWAAQGWAPASPAPGLGQQGDSRDPQMPAQLFHLGLSQPRLGPQERTPWLAPTFSRGWPEQPYAISAPRGHSLGMPVPASPCPLTVRPVQAPGCGGRGTLGSGGTTPHYCRGPGAQHLVQPSQSSDHQPLLPACLNQVQTRHLSGARSSLFIELTFPGPVWGRDMPRVPEEAGSGRPHPQLAGPAYLASYPPSLSTPGR